MRRPRMFGLEQVYQELAKGEGWIRGSFSWICFDLAVAEVPTLVRIYVLSVERRG